MRIREFVTNCVERRAQRGVRNTTVAFGPVVRAAMRGAKRD
jgi:hypothetical protein